MVGWCGMYHDSGFGSVWRVCHPGVAFLLDSPLLVFELFEQWFDSFVSDVDAPLFFLSLSILTCSLDSVKKNWRVVKAPKNQAGNTALQSNRTSKRVGQHRLHLRGSASGRGNGCPASFYPSAITKKPEKQKTVRHPSRTSNRQNLSINHATQRDEDDSRLIIRGENPLNLLL